MSRNLIGLFRPKRYSYMLLSFHLDAKDGHALNILLGIFQTTSSNPNILLSKNLMGCLRQHRDSEKLKLPYSHIKDSHALNSHLGILQLTSSFKPYILLSRQVDGRLPATWSLRTAKIIPFAYQRLPSTEQPSWNSSNIIIF